MTASQSGLWMEKEVTRWLKVSAPPLRLLHASRADNALASLKGGCSHLLDKLHRECEAQVNNTCIVY